MRSNSDMKDLQLQEAKFNLNDSQDRVRELEQKEAFSKAQLEKLTTETSQLQEELRQMKKENENSAKSDTVKADLNDKYKTLVQENKMLKKQLESKFNAERFT